MHVAPRRRDGDDLKLSLASQCREPQQGDDIIAAGVAVHQHFHHHSTMQQRTMALLYSYAVIKGFLPTSEAY